MAGGFRQWISDNGGDQSSYRVHALTTTAANFDAQAALRLALINAIAALHIGVVSGYEYIADENQFSQLPISSPLAQREIRLTIPYTGLSGAEYIASLPCFDLTLLVDGTEYMDTSSAEYIALKAAFEIAVYPAEVVTMGVPYYTSGKG